MSGGGTAKGPNPSVTIAQKSVSHDTAQKKISKDSRVDVGATQETTADVKIALLVRANQSVEALTIKGKNGVVVPVSPEPATQPVSGNAQTAFPATPGAKWVGFIAKYKKEFGKKFDTQIRLSNFEPSPNGFQVVTLVFTHSTLDFQFDPYFIANSVLPAPGSTFMVMAGAGQGSGSRRGSRKKTSASGKRPRGRSKR